MYANHLYMDHPLLRKYHQAKCTNAICYSADPLTFKNHLAFPGAARAWFEGRKTGPVASWMSSEDLEMHNKIFATENGGYGPPLNWYKAQIANLNTPDEALLTPERTQIHAPTLLVTCSLDYVGVPTIQEGYVFMEDMSPLQVLY